METVVKALIAEHRDQAGPLLPLLHAVQDCLGCVPAEAVPLIAQGLSLSRAEVHGVISHYPHFREQPVGRVLLQVCQAEACRACGAEALMQAAERWSGCAPHQTRADGAVTLEPVYCLGLCASSPAVMLNEVPHARMSEAKLHALLKAENLVEVQP